MVEELIDLVWRRAASCCEYCRLPHGFTRTAFEIDHIIARKHGGATIAANLALACFPCNSRKGPNVAGIDAATRLVVSLFHPRRHKWTRHFRWDGPILVGRTAIGRATVTVLEINRPIRVDARQALIEEGLFPPE